MAKERRGYRRQRKTGDYIDRRAADAVIRRKNMAKGKNRRKGPLFNPKAKIDRSQIQVRKSKSSTPYHWRTNKTKRKIALENRWKREAKADRDRDRQWDRAAKKGKRQIDWRHHAYDATTGYNNYMNGKDLKKKYPVISSKKTLIRKAAKRRVAVKPRRTAAKGRARAV